MRRIWNFLTYFSPIITASLLVVFGKVPKFLDFKDTNFTIEWSIATLAAGLILSNLPQSNKWVSKIKDMSGVFRRLSLFLMSPTIYGLIHYILAKLADGSFDHQQEITALFYISTLLSVIITVIFLVIIVVKVHEES